MTEPQGSVTLFDVNLLFNGNGIYRAAIGGSPDPGFPALFRLGDDGGCLSLDAEDLRHGISAHTAGDTAGGVDSDIHGGTSFSWCFHCNTGGGNRQEFFEQGNFFPAGAVFIIIMRTEQSQWPGSSARFLDEIA